MKITMTVSESGVVSGSVVREEVPSRAPRREPGVAEAALITAYRAAEADEAEAKRVSDVTFGAMKAATAVVDAFIHSGVHHSTLRDTPEWDTYCTASKASFVAEDAYQAAQDRRAAAWTALCAAETALAQDEARIKDALDAAKRRDREERERADIATVLSESGLNAEAVAEAGRLRDMEDAAKAEARREEDEDRRKALLDRAHQAEADYQAVYRTADWAARDGGLSVPHIGVRTVNIMVTLDLVRAAYKSAVAYNRAGAGSHQSPKVAAVRALREWATINKLNIAIGDAKRFVEDVLGLEAK